MKRFILLILILISGYSYAQDQNLKTKALLFSFNGLNLNSFYGGIGGKVWLSDYTALNCNLGLSSRNNTTAGNAGRTEGEERNKSIFFGIGIEKHFDGIENLEPYLVGRIEGSYTDRDYNPSVPIEYISWGSRSITRGISIQTGFGVEYWLADKISIAGQHLFAFNYSTGSNRNYEENVAQKIINRGLDTGTSSLILAIYF
jgi:hypothetical protein